MAKHQKYNIRSAEQLRPNREERPSTRQRATRNAFGLYLPLLTDVGQPLGVAIKNAAGFLAEERRGPSAELMPNDNFGMTFAQHDQVARAMREMLGHGFVLAHMIEKLQAASAAMGNEVEVPISGFAWEGAGRRKLAAQFAEGSVALDALRRQASAIQDALGEVRGAGRIEVRQPDHVRVATYGHPRDGMSLSRQHRADVAAIFHDEFSSGQGAPLTLTLGSLVVGRSYQSFDGLELTPTPQVDATLELIDSTLADFEPAFA
jgi:hypothetical protein